VAGLRFGILGPLEVSDGGRSVPVPSGRRRGVLAALVTRPGRPTSVDALIEAGWRDELPADPKAALHTVVSRLRAVLGESAILAVPGGYVLAVPPEAVDGIRFEHLCEAARSVTAPEAARLLDEALGLWRGAAYAEFGELVQVAAEAHRLELRRTDAREERARVALELGDAQDAVYRLESLLEEYPFRERALELLLTALQRCGRTVAALQRYGAHRARMVEELGLEPSPSLQALQRRLLRGAGPSTPSGPTAGPSNPPAWLDPSVPFVGREQEVGRLAELVAVNRVVAVVGPGGVGKSRLVAQALPAMARRAGLPVAVVELDSIDPSAESSAVDRVVADALGVGDAGNLRAALVGLLRSEPRLLVLDGCEQLVPTVRSLVEVVAGRCPNARIVLTSRHRLGAVGECVLSLAPLPVPGAGESGDRIRSSPSVRLLLDRIGRTGASASVDDATWPVLAAVCRHTDGLPLALELAAAQCSVLGVDVVEDHLRRDTASIDDLAGAARADAGGGDLGSGSVRALVDRSCALLQPSVQELFAELSVFVGRFDLLAADGVVRRSRGPVAGDPVPAGPVPADSVAGMLAALVDASLVSCDLEAGTVRYRLLGVLRAQAARRLAQSGRAAALRRAHAEWIAGLTEQASQDQTGPNGASTFHRLEAYRDDVTIGLRWALQIGDLELAARISGSVELCSHWTPPPDLVGAVIQCGERCLQQPAPNLLGLAATAMALVLSGHGDRGAELARKTLAQGPNTIECFLARLAVGIAALYTGDLDRARWSFEAIATAPDLTLAYRADAYSSLALLARYTGQRERAGEESRLALLWAETSGSPGAHAFACYAAGEAAVQTAERARLLRSAVAEAESIGSAQISTVARVALVAALIRDGRQREANEIAIPLLRSAARSGAWPQFWTTARILAEIEAAAGRPQEAALLLGAADSHPSAPPPLGEDVERYAKLRADLRTRLGARMADRIRAGAATASAEQIADRVLHLPRVDNSRKGVGAARRKPAYDQEDMEEQIRFCTAPDGVRIAFATTQGGAGRPLVRAATWLTHLEADRPLYQHWLDSFGRSRRFVRYDLRGCGLSDRDVDDFSLAAKVSDLEAVVAAVGADRFDVLGLSGGGPIAIAYAARHPERVAHLVLYGSFARGRGMRDGGSATAREEAELLVSLTRVGWGTPNPAFRRVFSTLFMPDAPPEVLLAYEELQRVSCSSETAVRIRQSSYDTDVSALARTLSVPTLVLHVRDDAVAPYEEGRRLAALIPGAEFLTLPGRNHLIAADDTAWAPFVESVDRFLATEPTQQPRANLGLLTGRESAVLSLVAQGLDNDQIAERLVLSARTVERHLSNIYAKLGLSGRAARAAAAAAYARSG
jgi:predicted ATPase/pimeloyl-ACP methyl ester carboxylesterase/DNA-binding SARP family transcriptional activator/DNA-binding CsgD family transcriptional regulator